MPRYFFHTEGKYARLDEEGTELPDLKAVRAEAVQTTGEMLRDAGLRLCSDDMHNGAEPWRLWVTGRPAVRASPTSAFRCWCRVAVI